MLNERKGVSDVVDNLSEKMGRCIINDAKQQKKRKRVKYNKPTLLKILFRLMTIASLTLLKH